MKNVSFWIFLLLLIQFCGFAQTGYPEFQEQIKIFETRYQENLASGKNRYAPSAFEEVRAAIEAVKLEWACIHTEEEMDSRTQELNDLFDQAIVTSGQSREIVGDLVTKRDQVRSLDFVRQFSGPFLIKADSFYHQAITYAEQGKKGQARKKARLAQKNYQLAIQNASGQIPMQKIKENMRNSMANTQRELELLSAANDGDMSAEEAEALNYFLMAKVNNYLPGFGDNYGILGGNISPYDFAPDIPLPADLFSITERTTTTLKMEWVDKSDNETGNRILKLRTGGFDTIAEFGPLEIFEKFSFTDTNLEPNKEYGYWLETYNEEGFSKTRINRAYTKDPFDVPVWRIQLVVHTADVEFADTDDRISISLHKPLGVGEDYNITYLDYGRDDFERGNVDVFDLNLTNISRLQDINKIMLKKAGVKYESYWKGSHSVDNQFGIEKIELFVNDVQVFVKDYSSQGYLWLTGEDEKVIAFSNELWQQPLWINYKNSDAYMQAFRKHHSYGGCAYQLSNEELISRVEGLIGHMLNSADNTKDLYWGERHGPAFVESTLLDDNTLAIDLDLKAGVDYFPDPEVDVDFDIHATIECPDEGNPVLNLTINNLDTEIDYDFFDYLTTVNFAGFVEFIGNLKADAATGGFSIVRKFELPQLDFLKDTFKGCNYDSCPSIRFSEGKDLLLQFEQRN